MKLLPNAYQIPNATIELMTILSKPALYCYLAIFRQTVGWHKEQDNISITQMQELTNLSRTSVVKGTRELASLNLISIKKVKYGSGEITQYTINLDVLKDKFIDNLVKSVEAKNKIKAMRKHAECYTDNAMHKNASKSVTSQRNRLGVVNEIDPQYNTITNNNNTPHTPQGGQLDEDEKISETEIQTDEIQNSKSEPLVDDKELCDSQDSPKSTEPEFNLEPDEPEPDEPKLDYERVAKAFNDAVATHGNKIPEVRSMDSDTRRSKVDKLFATFKKRWGLSHDDFYDAFERYVGDFLSEARDFYFGDNPREWVASFDYIIRVETLDKVVEGSL